MIRGCCMAPISASAFWTRWRLISRGFATRRKVGRLVSVGIGEVEEIAVYIRGQARAAAAVGLPFDEQHWPADLTQDECKARLVAMNDDPDVLGVILQRPVPDHINVRSLQSAIHPLKDVEGMNPASIGNIVYNQMALAPCTAAASVEMIRATGMKIEGWRSSSSAIPKLSESRLPSC